MAKNEKDKFIRDRQTDKKTNAQTRKQLLYPYY